MLNVLLDTDVASYLLKSDTRAEWYRNELKFALANLSFMTLSELEFWPIHRRWGAKMKATLEQFLSRFEIIYPDEETCRLWAQVRIEVISQGQQISVADAWNAAIAIQNEFPLVTHNASDYASITQLAVITAPQ